MDLSSESLSNPIWLLNTFGLCNILSVVPQSDYVLCEKTLVSFKLAACGVQVLSLPWRYWWAHGPFLKNKALNSYPLSDIPYLSLLCVISALTEGNWMKAGSPLGKKARPPFLPAVTTAGSNPASKNIDTIRSGCVCCRKTEKDKTTGR